MSAIRAEKLRLGQSNGPDVTLLVFGDEFYARYENEDGFSVVYDTDKGLYCYALVIDGEFVSSGMSLEEKPPEGIRRHMRESDQVRKAKFELRYGMMTPPPLGGGNAPTMKTLGPDNGLLEGPKIHQGKILGLTILVEFQDIRTEVTEQEIDAMLNSSDGDNNGNFCSVRDYFLTMSNGKLDYTNRVFGPVRLKHPRSYYLFTYRNEVVLEALAELESQGLDFSQFDQNGDGLIDAINIMYAGETQYVDRSWLWPHNFYIEKQLGNVRTLFYQICSLESQSIGTFCHENGHMLCRFPDLYDYGSRDEDTESSAGMGRYCLMSSGNHLNGGRTPAPICGYFRDLANWPEKVVAINNKGTYEAVHGDYKTLYKYFLQTDLCISTNEYFIIENRFRSGLDSYLPSSGLAVYHCDTNGSNEWQEGSPTRHYQCALSQADGRNDLERDPYNRGDAGDLFGKVEGVAMDYGSNPSTRRWDQSDSEMILADISESGEMIKFEIK